MAASSRNTPCSIESTPARRAAATPPSPMAWAATVSPSRWASSTRASSSAWV